MFIIDFTFESVLGSVFLRIILPMAKNLHCGSERIRNNHTKLLNELTDRHQMFKKLNELKKISTVFSPVEFQLQMNRWDDELTDYMEASENKCRSFK